MAEIINYARKEYTMWERKRLTFDKILDCRTLNYSQVQRLKTAQALFECVPITIYSPFAVYFLRKTAQAVTAPKLINLALQLVFVVPCVEFVAQSTKTRLYWPLIRQIYMELNEKEERQSKMISDIQTFGKEKIIDKYLIKVSIRLTMIAHLFKYHSQSYSITLSRSVKPRVFLTFFAPNHSVRVSESIICNFFH